MILQTSYSSSGLKQRVSVKYLCSLIVVLGFVIAANLIGDYIEWTQKYDTHSYDKNTHFSISKNANTYTETSPSTTTQNQTLLVELNALRMHNINRALRRNQTTTEHLDVKYDKAITEWRQEFTSAIESTPYLH